MKICRYLPFLMGFLLICSCVTMDSASTGNLTSEGGNTRPKVYYAGVPGLKLYSGCSFSSPTLAELALHEKVLRYKLERGLAYVKVAKSGQTGWVRNADLIWRLPSVSKKDTEVNLPVTAEPAPPKTVNPDPNPETERRDASMFDAF